MTINEKVNIKKIETKVLNSRKINIKITLEIETKVYSNDNLQIVCGVNNTGDIQILNTNKVVNSLKGEGNTKVYAKDTISIDETDELAEIMKADVRILDKDVKISYNKVLAKADAEISILYLTEDNRIKNMNARIPIMGFIDIENISDNNECDIDYKIKNIIIKPNNGDEHSIYVEMEIEIVCFVYETKNINLIEDLYSISGELDFKQKEITAMVGKRSIKEIYNINEQVTIPEIENNQLYNVTTNANIQNVITRNEKIIYEGELNLEILYETNNRVNSNNMQLPFNFEINAEGINENCNIDTNIDIKKDDFIVNNGKISLNVELEFNVSISNSEKINIIDEINVLENRNNNIYSMVIYFVRPGDTLWKIAKKFKSTVDDIAKINEIEDVSKIYPSQQLYIPKFIKREVAV